MWNMCSSYTNTGRSNSPFLKLPNSLIFWHTYSTSFKESPGNKGSVTTRYPIYSVTGSLGVLIFENAGDLCKGKKWNEQEIPCSFVYAINSFLFSTNIGYKCVPLLSNPKSLL